MEDNLSEDKLKEKGVDSMIPKKVLDASPAAVLDAQTSATELGLAMGADWLGSWRDVSSQAKTALSSLSEHKNRLDQYVELAENS